MYNDNRRTRSNVSTSSGGFGPASSSDNPAKPDRQVNNLLHNLRGEHFRHSQNVQKSRSHLSARTGFGLGSSGPSLPYSVIFGSEDPSRDAASTRTRENITIGSSSTPNYHYPGVSSSSEGSSTSTGTTVKTAAGPVPRSWALSSSRNAANRISYDTPAWRRRSLSLFFEHSPFPFEDPEETVQIHTTSESTALSISPSPSTSITTSTPILANSISTESRSRSRSRRPLSSLTYFCLRVLLEYYRDDLHGFTEDIVPYLLPHHRRQIVRWTAVHEPLSNAGLYPLFEPEGHAEGEIIVVGPQASLRSDLFQTKQEREQRSHGRHTSHVTIPAPPSSLMSNLSLSNSDKGVGVSGSGGGWDDAEEVLMLDEEEEIEEEDTWESTTHPIQSLALLSTTLTVPTLLTLPPSLTHLALIHLPSPIPVHRLPAKCPLLEVLDLSYNEWFTTTTWGEEVLGRIRWNGWCRLKVLGFRECGVKRQDEILKRVNEGRWEDVEIIL